ncbi:MAG TPA: tRNA (guanosine(37)-N1)-methyltransferase TrmD [Herpetosiphonaceae bacterium]
MRFDILTLFPAMFTGPLTESILKRAQQAGQLEVVLHDIRRYAVDRHKSADDYPFGGGAGMVMKPEVVYQAIADVLGYGEQARAERDVLIPPPDHAPVISMSPAGERFTQRIAEELAHYPRLVLVCGHYEGIDERVRECCIDRELSIGDYVLTGGELAAMVIVDAVARLQPGVLAAASTAEESHSDHLLEYPHYTRPAVWRGQPIPEVLLSGHHANVARWRHEQRLLRTLQRRPDLLEHARLSDRDREYLQQHGWSTSATKDNEHIP